MSVKGVLLMCSIPAVQQVLNLSAESVQLLFTLGKKYKITGSYDMAVIIMYVDIRIKK